MHDRMNPPRARDGRRRGFATLRRHARPPRRRFVALTIATLLAATPSASAATPALPTPDHVLIVVMENKDPGEVLGGSGAPYLNALAQAGASFSDAHAETHPSQPNYLALFSGSTQGVTDDSCDHSFDAPNLGAALLAAGRTFVGYAEALPQRGLHGVHGGPVRAQAQPLGELHQPPRRHHQPARIGAGDRLGPAADGRLPHPRPVPRHARLPRRRR